ncbi:MAG: pyridoxamine 5'-phosphate oxidase family protein [Candidatus Eremiobacteraeota bacterium]|nr:pyridoxamine 5'-phosphate oxidase family protein [Candidatus Eremiobacteraeota bacterium]
MRPPDALLAALQEVCQGKPFPWCWLATSDAQSGAQVRTVRLLAYNWIQSTVTFASHGQHSKHRQLAADPRGQLCMLREAPLLQVRLQATWRSQPGASHPQGERLWQKLSPQDKVRLYQGHPQHPKVPDQFWLVDGHFHAVEVVRLGEECGRVRYLRGESGWESQTLPL